jgi:hypothetical protein
MEPTTTEKSIPNTEAYFTEHNSFHNIPKCRKMRFNSISLMD